MFTRKPYAWVVFGASLVLLLCLVGGMSAQTSLDGLLRQGDLCMTHKQWQEARTAYEEATKQGPQNVVAHYKLAHLYRLLITEEAKIGNYASLGKYAKGFSAELDAALKLDGDYVPARVERGISKLDTPAQYGGNIDIAISDFQFAITKEPRNIAYRMHLVEAYKKKNDKEKAIKQLDEVLAINPKYSEARSMRRALKASPVNVAAMPLLLDDFDDGNTISKWQTQWVALTDQTTGGTSVSRVFLRAPGANGSARAFEMSGTVTKKFQYGFAGMHVNLDKNSAKPSEGSPVDISGYHGIQFYAKGDKKQYCVKLVTAGVTDFDHFFFVFTAGEDWQLVRAPFSELRQFGYGRPAKWKGADVQAIEFMTFGAPPIKSFTLSVDQVSFY